MDDFEAETSCSLLVDCSANPLLEAQVKSELAACYCARNLPAEYEEMAEVIWKGKVAANPKVCSIAALFCPLHSFLR